MKLVIEIDENEINEAVKDILVKQISEEIHDSYGKGWEFKYASRDVMREVIKDNMDLFADRAIAAAAKSIENRGIKRAVVDLLKEN